jgi:hypothetical protein
VDHPETPASRSALRLPSFLDLNRQAAVDLYVWKSEVMRRSPRSGINYIDASAPYRAPAGQLELARSNSYPT